MQVAQLSEDPEGARAPGSLYWEARSPESEAKAPLRCVVGEDWIFERSPKGGLRMLLWLNPMHPFLARSSMHAPTP